MSPTATRTAPSPRIRLLYFPWAGRGQPIRDCLRLGGVDFEDVRLSVPEFRAQRAAGAFPFDLLPVLELEGGVRIGQSNTVLRWAAQQAGLTPEDPIDALRVESLIDMVEDYAARLSVTIREPDPAVRAHQRAGLAGRWMPELYANLTRQLQRADTGWLVGDRLTAADLKAYHLLCKLTDGSLDGMPTDALADQLEVRTWMERVRDARECLRSP